MSFKAILMCFVAALFYNVCHAQDTATGRKVFSSVEILPKYPGGTDAFYAYINSHINYPKADYKKHIEGRAVVIFTIERNGSVSDVKYLSAPSKTLGKEAVRVVSLSPRWEPAMQNEKLVRIQYTVPVVFTLKSAQSQD